MNQTISNAFSDMADGVSRYRVWMALAHEDVGDQHRQTALGPLWLLLNYLIYMGTFLVLFGGAHDFRHYAMYIATGLFVWLYLLEVITQSTTLFKREQSFISGTTLPLSVYVLRLTMQSIIRSFYTLIGCVGVLIMVQAPLSLTALWSLAGIALIVATTPAVIIVFAMTGVFFPDITFIIQNLMRVGIFLTPIFWIHAAGLRGLLYRWNPFTYELEIVRQPIVNGTVPIEAFLISSCIAVLFWALAIFMLGRLRRQVVFVL